MTAWAGERTLPLRVPIVPGEALDSWLEALARRNGLILTKLLAALDLPIPYATHVLVHRVTADALRRLERQTGLATRRLDEAVADRFGAWSWNRTRGSRYCPHCLKATLDDPPGGPAGRWLLAWRLPWVFACTRHQVLLADACPACGQTPRSKDSLVSASVIWHDAATCASRTTPHPGPRRLCGTDLTAAPAARLAADDPLLAAQHRIDTLLATILTTTRRPSPNRLPRPGEADHGGGAAAFTDLWTIARWLAPRIHEWDIARYGSPALHAYQDWRGELANRSYGPGRVPSAAPIVGAAIAAAITLLTDRDDTRYGTPYDVDGPSADGEIISRLRSLLRDGPARREIRPGDMSREHWYQLSVPTHGRFLRAMDAELKCKDRLRYRSCTAMARLPDLTPAAAGRRAAHIPQMLWPDWTIRLRPTRGFHTDTFRRAMAASLLLPGQPAGQTASPLHPHMSPITTGTVLGRLTRHGHHDVLTAICLIADYLDTHDVPIDYQRRRDRIIPADLLSREGWRRLCRDAEAHAGDARRHQSARRYLYQLLTGADLADPRIDAAFDRPYDRVRHLRFTAALSTPLRDALHDYAADHLHRLGIDESLTWQPPAIICAHLALPGHDPDGIDLDTLNHLLNVEQLAPRAAAQQLGTTIDHVRLALERIPRSPRPHRDPTPSPRQRKVSDLLTREFFEREYINAGKRLRQLSAETGICRPTLSRYARRAGIALVNGGEDRATSVDEAWLREQYLQRKRSFPGIARELGVGDMAVINVARRYHIPSRPPGIASRPDFHQMLDPSLPRDIRRAIEGGLFGRQRLHRFQVAMAFPTIDQAADHLGAYQSVLVKQLHRLEHDIGAQLFYRSTTHQPMRPTEHGTALLRAFDQPDVQALLREEEPGGGIAAGNRGEDPANHAGQHPRKRPEN